MLGRPDPAVAFVAPEPPLRFIAIDFPGGNLVFAWRAFSICARSHAAEARPGHAAYALTPRETAARQSVKAMKMRKLVKADRERRDFFIRILLVRVSDFGGKPAFSIRPPPHGRMQESALDVPFGRMDPVLLRGRALARAVENQRGAPLIASPVSNSISTRAVCCETTVNGRLCVATRLSTRVFNSRR